MIPRPFFDRPIWTDPLFWFGIVIGLAVSVVVGMRADLPLADFVWQVFASTFAFTWWTAGLLLSTIRHYFRRRRAARDHDAELVSNGSPPTR